MKLKLEEIELEIDGDVESVVVDGKKVKVKIKQPLTYYYSPYWNYPYYYSPNTEPFTITTTTTSSTISDKDIPNVWYTANKVFEEHNL